MPFKDGISVDQNLDTDPEGDRTERSDQTICNWAIIVSRGLLTVVGDLLPRKPSMSLDCPVIF